MIAFALKATDVDLVVASLAEVLKWPFAKHHSMYLGNYCLHRVTGVREVKVRENRDPLHNPATNPPDERFHERNYPAYNVLVYATLPVNEEAAFITAVRETFPDAVAVHNKWTS